MYSKILLYITYIFPYEWTSISSELDHLVLTRRPTDIFHYLFIKYNYVDINNHVLCILPPVNNQHVVNVLLFYSLLPHLVFLNCDIIEQTTTVSKIIATHKHMWGNIHYLPFTCVLPWKIVIFLEYLMIGYFSSTSKKY